MGKGFLTLSRKNILRDNLNWQTFFNYSSRQTEEKFDIIDDNKLMKLSDNAVLDTISKDFRFFGFFDIHRGFCSLQFSFISALDLILIIFSAFFKTVLSV